MINVNKNKRWKFLFISFLRQGALLLALMILFQDCRQKRIILKSPPHYDFSAPEEVKLDIRLKEISGICWDTKANRFLAIQDESGKLFLLDKETKRIDSVYEFGGKGDYEDVTMANGSVYILKSDGTLTKLIMDSAGHSSGAEVGKLNPGGSADFESLYYDPARRALIILCKNCDADGEKNVSAFAYYMDSTGFDNNPIFRIDAAEVQKIAVRKTSKLQPSAAAIHPVLQKIFILSSASNQLIITDLDGRPEFAFVLSKKLFPQPEGLCFKQNGDMYISNEGVTGKSTLIKFQYKP